MASSLWPLASLFFALPAWVALCATHCCLVGTAFVGGLMVAAVLLAETIISAPVQITFSFCRLEWAVVVHLGNVPTPPPRFVGRHLVRF